MKLNDELPVSNPDKNIEVEIRTKKQQIIFDKVGQQVKAHHIAKKKKEMDALNAVKERVPIPKPPRGK